MVVMFESRTAPKGNRPKNHRDNQRLDKRTRNKKP